MELDKIIQMQAQGMPESEIVKNLRDEGISPMEISDALNQARIKQAVAMPESMEQSIMQEPEQPVYAEEPQQQYPQYEYPQYEQQQGYEVDTISEIAEQIVSEKFSEYTKKTGDIVSFRNQVSDKLKDLDERLRRIESSIDRIQQMIIGKIGEFGDNMSFMHKDLENMHSTMSKLMNPLIDNYKELKKMAK